MRVPRFVFWPLASLLILCDCATKRAIEETETPGVPHPIVDGVLRFTLEYNRGAAFSTHLGRYERFWLIAGGFAILSAMIYIYRDLMRRHANWFAVTGAALVVGGAIGNLLDRVRSPRGVVDFIDVGFNASRFFIFNVADIGLSVGAVLLAIAVWRAEAARGRRDGAAVR